MARSVLVCRPSTQSPGLRYLVATVLLCWTTVDLNGFLLNPLGRDACVGTENTRLKLSLPGDSASHKACADENVALQRVQKEFSRKLRTLYRAPE